MRAFELVAKIHRAVSGKGVAGSQVMMIREEDGRILVPNNVVVEYHEDTGDHTVWIEVSDY